MINFKCQNLALCYIWCQIAPNLAPCITFAKFNAKFSIALENTFYVKMPNFSIGTQIWHCIGDALTNVKGFFFFISYATLVIHLVICQLLINKDFDRQNILINVYQRRYRACRFPNKAPVRYYQKVDNAYEPQ